jgi:hypothetical protein
VYIPETGFFYQVYPKEGLTYMTGWMHDCAYDFTFKKTRQIPTVISVADDGMLTLVFNMNNCTNSFKYVFTGTMGQTFTLTKNGKWELRPLVAELRD